METETQYEYITAFVNGTHWDHDWYLSEGFGAIPKFNVCYNCGKCPLDFVGVMLDVETGNFVSFGRECLDECARAQVDFLNLENKIATIKTTADEVLANRAAGKREIYLKQAPEEIRRIYAYYSTLGFDLVQEAYGTFVADVISKMDKFGGLTIKQEVTVCKAVNAKDAAFEGIREDATNWVNAPKGKVIIEAEILSVKEYNAEGGVHYWKALYKASIPPAVGHFKVWAGIPSILTRYNDPTTLKGQKVKLSVTLEPKAEDPKFAWGKFPRLLTPYREVENSLRKKPKFLNVKG